MGSINLGLSKEGHHMQNAYFDSQFKFLTPTEEEKLIRKTAQHTVGWVVPEAQLESIEQRVGARQTDREKWLKKFPKGLTADMVWDFAGNQRAWIFLGRIDGKAQTQTIQTRMTCA